MTRELEPCPFCPEGVLPVRLKKDGKPTGIVAHACYALGREIRVPEHVWQTRYKRTCHVIKKRQEAGECSECGGFLFAANGCLPKQWTHCPNCGAEVADE